MDAWKDKSGTNKLDRINKNKSNWKKILYTTEFSENDSQGWFELYCVYYQCFLKNNSEHLPQKRWYWDALRWGGGILRENVTGVKAIGPGIIWWAGLFGLISGSAARSEIFLWHALCRLLLGNMRKWTASISHLAHNADFNVHQDPGWKAFLNTTSDN